jgi:hypothetical protein
MGLAMSEDCLRGVNRLSPDLVEQLEVVQALEELLEQRWPE